MTLPVLDQGIFPALPKCNAIRVADTVFGSAELEFAAAVIITGCMRLGQWAPVSTFLFVEVLEKHPLFALLGRSAFNSTRELEVMGYVSITREGSVDYVVPLPSFAAAIDDKIIFVR